MKLNWYELGGDEKTKAIAPFNRGNWALRTALLVGLRQAAMLRCVGFWEPESKTALLVT